MVLEQTASVWPPSPSIAPPQPLSSENSYSPTLPDNPFLMSTMSSDEGAPSQTKRQRTHDVEPASHNSAGASYTTVHDQGPQGNPYPPPVETSLPNEQPQPPPPRRRARREQPHAPHAAELYNHAQMVQASSPSPDPEVDPSLNAAGSAGGNHYAQSSGVPRLPPILQVEKQQVTTSATQMASASRRRNEAHFVCPVPGCGSTFTRRFNLRG
jgi:hypothetical protein